MIPVGLALFDTAIGRCGLAWSAAGIVGVQLPEANGRATRRHLHERFPDAPETVPPRQVQDLIADVVALLEGEPRRLDRLPLDLEGVPPFHRRVYEVTRSIGPGETMTYGEIASRLGDPGAARAVGQALGANPLPLIVPCHRVLAAGDRLGGFSASGGVLTKLRLLQIEGAAAARQRGLFDEG